MDGEQGIPSQANDSTAPAIEDFDEATLREAMAAAKAEQAGGQGNEAAPASPADGTPAGQAPQGQPQADVPAPMIPKGRFDQVVHRARHFESEAQRLARENAELRAAQASAQPPVPPVEQRQATLDERLQVAAKKFDDGDFTMSDFIKEQAAVRAEQAKLDDEVRQARAPKEEPTPHESLDLQRQTAALEEKYPYVQHLNDRQFNFIAGEAHAKLTAAGVTLNDSEYSKLLLRQKFAELSDVYGPGFFHGNAEVNDAVAAARGGKQPAVVAPSSSQAPAALSPEARARLAKAGMQETMPVTADTMNGGTGGTGALTEDSINAMTPEEIDALPSATRQRMLGLTS